MFIKKLFLFLFSIYSLINLNAQNYEPMAVDGAHWLIFSMTDNGPDHHFIKVNGDTIINGINYKKTYKQEIINDPINPSELISPYYIKNESLIVFMRDDTINKKVFFQTNNNWEYNNCNQFTDELIHDFSLNAGDTLNTCLHLSPDGQPIIVDSIFTQYIWGKERRHFQLSAGGFGITEAIGANGPFWPAPFLSAVGNPTILMDYCIGTDEECGLLPTSENEARKDWNLLLHPNPVSGLLSVHLPDNLNFPIKVTIQDMTARRLLKKTLFQKTAAFLLETQQLQSGIYYISVLSDNNLAVKRFVKN
ncbi:MAG: T9SS type A sorting domain-containing protein [Bacteroidota bacterium]